MTRASVTVRPTSERGQGQRDSQTYIGTRPGPASSARPTSGRGQGQRDSQTYLGTRPVQGQPLQQGHARGGADGVTVDATALVARGVSVVERQIEERAPRLRGVVVVLSEHAADTSETRRVYEPLMSAYRAQSYN